MRAHCRRLFLHSVVAGALSAAGVLACTPFGAAGGAVGDDASPTSDASFDGAPPPASPDIDGGADAELPLDGGAAGPGTCLDFRTGTHGMTATGATHGPEGYRLEIGPGRTSSIRKTFTAPLGDLSIAHSVVSVLATSSRNGPFDTGAYLDLMAQYLGPTASYQSAPAMELEALETRLELNVWNAPNTYDRPYPIEVSGALPSPTLIRIDTRWADGQTRVTLGSAAFPLTTKKTSTTASAFTVVVGGKTYGGTTPNVTLTVQMLCVALE